MASREIYLDNNATTRPLPEVREAMLGQWDGWSWASIKSLLTSRLVLALVITYLLMAALFANTAVSAAPVVVDDWSLHKS